MIGDKVIKATLYEERADFTPVDIKGPGGLDVNQAVMVAKFGKELGELPASDWPTSKVRSSDSSCQFKRRGYLYRLLLLVVVLS